MCVIPGWVLATSLLAPRSEGISQVFATAFVLALRFLIAFGLTFLPLQFAFIVLYYF